MSNLLFCCWNVTLCPAQCHNVRWSSIISPGDDILAPQLLPDAEHAVDVLVAGLGPRGAAPEVVILLVTAVSVSPTSARPVSPLWPPQLLHIHGVNLTTGGIRTYVVTLGCWLTWYLSLPSSTWPKYIVWPWALSGSVLSPPSSWVL